MGKTAGIIIGFVLGLLVPYLFQPSFLGFSPSMGEWFSDGLQQPDSAPVIIICAVVGTVLGGVAGAFMDRGVATSGAGSSRNPGDPS